MLYILYAVIHLVARAAACRHGRGTAVHAVPVYATAGESGREAIAVVVTPWTQ